MTTDILVVALVGGVLFVPRYSARAADCETVCAVMKDVDNESLRETLFSMMSPSLDGIPFWDERNKLMSEAEARRMVIPDELLKHIRFVCAQPLWGDFYAGAAFKEQLLVLQMGLKEAKVPAPEGSNKPVD